MADLDLQPIDDIEIIPSTMQGGIDSGIPTIEPADAPKPKPPAKKEAPKPDPEVMSLRERLAAADRERERFAGEAASEKAARERAERDAATNIDYAVKTHGRAVGSEYREALAAQREIVSGIETVQAFQKMAKENLERALADDNMPAADRAKIIAAATEQIGAANARLETLENGRRGVEQSVAEAKQTYEDTLARLQAARDSRPEPTREPEVKAADKPAPTKAPATADEFIEAVAPQAAKAWLKEHKEFATPGSKENRKLNAFAAEWLVDNPDANSLNSEAFVEAMNAKFFPEEAEVADEVTDEPVAAAERPATRQAAPAAPVSRASGPSGKKSGAIQLTPEQYATAPEVITEFADLDPDFQARFKAWSPTAARYQYERNLQRAKREKPHRFGS